MAKSIKQSSGVNPYNIDLGKLSKSLKSKTKTKTNIGDCFVLMPFSEPFNTYYRTIIKPAINNAKLETLRGDSLFRPSPIMADIWQFIQKTKLLVAELTTKNANVFYELGLAHAIGKPVILLSETIEDVPFDLQSLRVIIYDKNDPSWGNKLKLKLTKAINETLNNPVDSVPQMFRKIVKNQAPIDPGLDSRVSALERKIELSVSDNKSIKAMPFNENSFIDDIRVLLSRSHSLSEARRAMLIAQDYGLPRHTIEMLLSEYVPSDVKKTLLTKYYK